MSEPEVLQTRPSPMARIVPLVIIAAVAAGLWFGLSYFERGLQQSPPPMMRSGGFALPEPRPLKPFSLAADDGTALTEETIKGRWTFLSFGYTLCPDVCPTMMATYKEIDRLLSEAAGAPLADFLFVSVDPERDSPEQIGKYARYFNPRFRGATGPHESLRALTDQLGILYARAEGQETAVGYLVDHSAAIMLIDPQGRLAAIFSTPHDPRAMAEDFAALARATP